MRTDKWLSYHLADDWLFISDHDEWRSVADKRRRERAVRPPLEVRQVFYGRPLVEFIARETFAAYARRETPGVSKNKARSKRFMRPGC